MAARPSLVFPLGGLNAPVRAHAPQAVVEVPATFPDPFDIPPCEVARLAASRLTAELEAGSLAPGVSSRSLDLPGQGKMFGVLVVRTRDGGLGYCRAFSGMLHGSWDIEGFVPPLFDPQVRAAVEVPGEVLLKRLLADAAAIAPGLEADWENHRALVAELARQRGDLVAQHRTRREVRRVRRAHLEPGPSHQLREGQPWRTLDQESRSDKAELRRLDARHAAVLQASLSSFQRLDRRHRALERLRAMVSSRLMQAIHDSYWVPATSGHLCRLRELFGDREPPGGAGDCAAPKLLGYAHRAGLQPIALAEFWWGSSPATSGRRRGAFYPPCRSKCAPVLEFMLGGTRAMQGSATVASTSRAPVPIVYEDDWIVVIAKPPGLLAVPGREPAGGDSVLGRLGASHPDKPLMVVHRLDMDTSGIMVLAKDGGSHAELQRQFTRREVMKRYVAWVEGAIARDQGRIDLPIRVDLEDRPRQVHDPVHGKVAVTDWHVLDRSEGRTRIAFFPRTGRTHQLRVHASHPLGLAAPIVGDRLYGEAGGRMLLHAECLELRHPRSGRSMSFRDPAPF